MACVTPQAFMGYVRDSFGFFTPSSTDLTTQGLGMQQCGAITKSIQASSLILDDLIRPSSSLCRHLLT